MEGVDNIQDHFGNFSKERETKKELMEILEMRNTVTECLQ